MKEERNSHFLFSQIFFLFFLNIHLVDRVARTAESSPTMDEIIIFLFPLPPHFSTAANSMKSDDGAGGKGKKTRLRIFSLSPQIIYGVFCLKKRFTTWREWKEIRLVRNYGFSSSILLVLQHIYSQQSEAIWSVEQQQQEKKD